MDAPSDNSTKRLSQNSLPLTGKGIIIDIGTGDGLFVSQSARQHPHKFFIGIDANPRPLEKISEKIHRKPAKGGLPNVMFLQAAVEDLPIELGSVADEVHIHFPWGSLLRGLVLGDDKVLKNLRRVCVLNALMEIVVGLDIERDRTELERLGIGEFNLAYIDAVLASRFRASGFEIMERGEQPHSSWSELHTSWAKRLKENPRRRLTYIVARAMASFVTPEASGREY